MARKGTRDEEGGWKGYLGSDLEAVLLGKDFKGVLDEGLARFVVVDLAMMSRKETRIVSTK